MNAHNETEDSQSKDGISPKNFHHIRDRSQGRVGILSRHAVSNYGSILQACALQWALEDLGYDPCYINYRPRSDSPVATFKRNPFRPVTPLRAFSMAVSDHKFETMRRGILHQTRRVHAADEMRLLSHQFDALCVGGDQVWNVLRDDAVDGAYLLEFAKRGISGFSYGSSFGSGSLDDADENRFKASLSRFVKVSVREPSGVEILGSIGIGSTVVVDPVYLLTPNEWDHRIPPTAPRRLKPRNFVVVYNLHRSDEFYSYLNRVLGASSLEVVSIRPSLRRSYGRNLFYPRMSEFLWLLQNSACVYTDSFHGTALSILFNTPFVEWVPRANEDRNISLLSSYDLMDRLASNLPNGSLGDMDDRWEPINAKLAQLRKESLGYLAEAARIAVSR